MRSLEPRLAHRRELADELLASASMISHEGRHVVALVAIGALVACKRGDARTEGAASGAAVPPAPGFLTGFEGDVVLQVTSSRRVQRVAVTVKGATMRFELPESMRGASSGSVASYALVDAGTRRIRTVLSDRRAFVELDFARPSTAAGTRVEKTGHTDTVAGIPCEDWELTNAKSGRALVCVSTERAPWLDVPALGLPHADLLWVPEVFDGKHFPVRAIEYDAAGAEDGRIELTKLERKVVDDSTLAIPAGYRKMEVGELMDEVGAAMASARVGRGNPP
jgi:hypothetical protein